MGSGFGNAIGEVMSDVLDAVLADLRAEGEQLQQWVSDLTPEQWATKTTDEGWTVAHQVAHLMWTDEVSVYAATDKEAFDAMIMSALNDPEHFVDQEADRLAKLPSNELLARWNESRANLEKVLRETTDKIPWFGPPMSATSMATARIMETWAHSLDVAEGLGIEKPKNDRVKHICHLGVRTRGFAYSVRGKEAPDVEIRIELTSPSGELWTWGPEDALERITGSAWDFGLLAVRRRHRDDTDVKATGEHASDWLNIIQAFAGMPGNDPKRLEDR